MKSLVQARYGWSLTCKDSQEKDVYFRRGSSGSVWREYEVVRKD